MSCRDELESTIRLAFGGPPGRSLARVTITRKVKSSVQRKSAERQSNHQTHIKIAMLSLA